MTCECQVAGHCPRFNQIQSSRDLEVCRGVHGDELRASYTMLWESLRDGKPIDTTGIHKPPGPFTTCLHLGHSLRRPDGRAERSDFPL